MFLSIFIVLLIFVVLLMMVKGPFAGLYVFTVMLYLKPAIFHAALTQIHLTRIIAVLILLTFMFQVRRRKKIVFFEHSLSKWLFAFVLAVCCSMITSIWRSNTLHFIQGFLKVVLGYLLVVNISTDLKKCRWLMWAMILSMLYIVISSLKQYIGYGRLFGAFRGALFGDPNDLAMGLIVLIPFLYFGMFRKKNIVSKGIDLGIMGLFFYVIMLTQSRGGMIGMCAMLLALWWKSKRKVLGAIIGLSWSFLGLLPFQDSRDTQATATTNCQQAISGIASCHLMNQVNQSHCPSSSNGVPQGNP